MSKISPLVIKAGINNTAHLDLATQSIRKKPLVVPPALPPHSRSSTSSAKVHLSPSRPQNATGVKLNQGPNTISQTKVFPYWNYQSANIINVDGRKLSFIPSEEQVNQNTFGGKIKYGFFKAGTYKMTFENALQQKLSADLGSRGKVDLAIHGRQATLTGNPNGVKLPEEGIKIPISGIGSAHEPYRIEFNDLLGKKHHISWFSPKK